MNKVTDQCQNTALLNVNTQKKYN